jgi:hypothetical protein
MKALAVTYTTRFISFPDKEPIMKKSIIKTAPTDSRQHAKLMA